MNLLKWLAVGVALAVAGYVAARYFVPDDESIIRARLNDLAETVTFPADRLVEVPSEAPAAEPNQWVAR